MRILLDTNIILDSLLARMPFFEDAVQLACAMNENLDAIVTRDLQGFVNSPIPILTPGEILGNLF